MRRKANLDVLAGASGLRQSREKVGTTKHYHRMCHIFVTVFLISFALTVQFSEARPRRRFFYYMKNLSFTEPCPERGHDFHEPTGNFMCRVQTGKECADACIEKGCREWSFTSFMDYTDTTPRDHYRCRCVPAFGLCTYNYIPTKFRRYE